MIAMTDIIRGNICDITRNEKAGVSISSILRNIRTYYMVSVVAVYFMMKIVYYQVFKNCGLKFGNSSYFFAKKGKNLNPNMPTFFL